MAINIFDLKQTSSSKSTSRVKDINDAKNRLKYNLGRQRTAWIDDKGASLPDKPTKGQPFSKKALWFRKMDLTDDYMLQLKIGQVAIKTDPETNDAWFYPIPETKMIEYIDSIVQQIDDGSNPQLEKAIDVAYKEFARVNKL